jgi:hypothetical protein
MSIFDEFAADASEIVSEIGRTVTFRGNPVSAIVSEPQVGESLMAGGFKDSTSYSVKFVRSTLLAAPFSGLPETGEVVIIEGREFTINAVSSRAFAAWVRVDVEPRDF